MPPIPDPVAELSQSALEWDRLVEFLASYAQSAVGRAWLTAAIPSTNLDWIKRQHTLVDEARVLQTAGVRPAMGSLFDPTEALAKARLEGAVLEPEEIRQVVDLAEQTAAWAAFLRSPGDDLAERLPALIQAASEMVGVDLHPLVEAVRAKLLPDGSLADDASPELKRLRREMERQQRAIADSLRGALRRFAEGGTTQEDLITIRGERFVIPVKAEWKRRVPGVVHGASSSGQTVYVEPLETIELNNELVRLLEEEQAEIHRIYVAMTRQIGQFAAPIQAGARVLAELDTVMARAKFAEEYSAVRPQNDRAGQPELLLKAARHPLLERRLRASGGKVVPVSVALDDEHRQLIISGPNTGGKTVTLKTVALAAMMAQAGVPVCAEEARLPLLTGFLADIGDAQSIEQNLSTFSAHIVRLNKIASEAGLASLVLLDELGSATDPEEGAALAVAIAEHFLRARAWSIISTHHTSLKIYAETTPGVLNAAVGFDEQTLAPTYVLRQGVPGASAGINIARRLGLRPEIVDAARSRLSTQTLDIARFLDKLHEQLKELEAERLRTQQLEGELRRERTRLEVEGLKEWRAKVRELELQLQSLIKDFEYQARETVKAIDDRAAQQKLSKEAERRIARLRREFGDSFNSTVVAQHTGADRGDQHAQPHLPQRVTAGDIVKLRSLGKTATVQRQVDERTFEVAIGPMKMRVSRDEIAEVVGNGAASGEDRQATRARLRSKGVSVQMSDPDPVMSWEVNVIGRTADEAQDEVEKFLDRAVMAGLPRIRVIHGTGMGVLRRTLRQWLQQHPHVSQVTEPPYNEGGSGATIVELRQ